MTVSTHNSFFQAPRLSAALLAAALVCIPALPAHGLPAAAPVSSPAPAAAPSAAPAAAANAAKANAAPPLTEEMLRQRFLGKVVFLRGLYVGDDLTFDMNGKVKGTPGTASFTLSALQVRKIDLNKKKLEIEADRYALHFDGALPYQSDSKSFDKVKISKKPIHITIERELVVTLKKKKEKKEKKEKAKKETKASTGKELAGNATVPASPAPPPAAAPAPPPVPVLAPGTTLSPAHSAMVLQTALGKVFASDIDQQMMVRLPAYWQRYFQSKEDHHEFQPSGVLPVGADVTPPRVLNSIDPSSNQYAQKYGIAGLTLFRTVVDATGKPQQVAITRPIGFGLDEAAVQAIKASRFRPAMKDGKPVAAVIDVVVTFRIYSNRTKPGSVKKGQKQTQVVASAWDAGTTESSAKPIQ